MKVLTVWQPWATLIAEGAKPYEFRGWKPSASLIGRRIAIHAGARKVRDSEIIDLLWQLERGEACLHEEPALDVLCLALVDPGVLTLSHVLCTAVLGEPMAGDACAREFGIDAGNDSDRADTFNWGWPMLQVERVLPPVPWRGRQGFGEIPDSLLEVQP